MTSGFLAMLGDALGRDDALGILARFLADDWLAGSDHAGAFVDGDELVDHLRRRGAHTDVLEAAVEAWGEWEAVRPSPPVVPAPSTSTVVPLVAAMPDEEALAHRLEREYGRDGGPA